MTYYLTNDDIAWFAPAALATAPDEARSDRYVFVDTMEVLDSFRSNGWDCVRAMQPRSYKSGNTGTKQHQLVLRSRLRDLSFEDPRKKTLDGSVARLFPEIILQNSHNGVKKLQLKAGLFAMICRNGMTISTHEFGLWQTRHQGIDPQIALGLIDNFTQNIDSYLDDVHVMADTNISLEDQRSLATVARNIRWGDDSDLDVNYLLQSRRPQDSGNDVWRTFNRVQENVLRGGFKLNKRTSREVKNIDLRTEINDKLWSAALSYCTN